MLKMLHMAKGKSQLNVKGPLVQALDDFGDIEVLEKCGEMDEAEVLKRMRETDVLITMWGALPVPAELAENPGKLRYILHLTGTCKQYIPIEIIRSTIPVTNWGDAPANAIAEGAMALLLTVLKDIRARTESISSGNWCGARRIGIASGTLDNTKLGLYGCGAIGNRFVELVKAFNPELMVYDPYAEKLPECCRQVDSLEELFNNSEVIAIFAGLSDETQGSVNSDLLAKLPDQGIIINVARGDIIEQEALFAELKKGRLRAGLDVLSGNDAIPADHEARTWPNLILSCHDINSANWPEKKAQLSRADKIALDNLSRFVANEPLQFCMDEKRYNLST